MKSLYLLPASVAIAILSGCGGGGGSSSNSSTITGQFVDSAVQGLEYSCSSGTDGITDANGNFICNTGDSVTFSINGFKIGSAKADKIITPKTLYPNDAVAVTNLAQLLQTLDSDNNADNGITIDAASQAVQSLNKDIAISLSQLDFDSVISSYIGKALVDETTANAHLDATLNSTETNTNSNTNTDVTSESMVSIITGITQSFCNVQDYVDVEFDGYANYTDFKNHGGTATWSYFSGTKTCSDYPNAGFCLVQDLSTQIGGSASCVSIVTFPDSAETTIEPPKDGYSTTTEYMTQEELTSFINTYNLTYSGYKNYVLMSYKWLDAETIFNSAKHYSRVSDSFYSFESGEFYLEILGLELKNGTFKQPIAHYSTLDKELIGDVAIYQYHGTGRYVDYSEYVDYGGGDKWKFSKILDKNLLNSVYPNIVFGSGDYGQFVYDLTDSSLAANSLCIKLYLNESAINKILIYLQVKHNSNGSFKK
jgi:hypothetical protein